MKVSRTIILGALFSNLLLFAPVYAGPITVEFYTTGVFSLSGTNTIGNPSEAVQITFTGVGSSGSPINITSPDNEPLGTFTITRGDNNSQFNLSGTFTLSMFQTIPSLGNDALLGTLEGQIKTDGRIDFTGDTSGTIGIVTYSLTGLTTNELGLPDASRNSFSQVSLFADITHSHTGAAATTAVPEPSSILLLASGVALGGLGTAARRIIARL